MTTHTSIVITGASAGIGEALALHYAENGVFLALSGRNAARLDTVADACRAKGATVRADIIDVTDANAMAAWINDIDETHPISLLIANAGISSGTAGRNGDDDRVRALFAVNVDGVLNSVLPVMGRMKERGHGQIALMSSIAAFRGFPGASAYCATKAAVKTLGEGMRLEVGPSGIRVNVICPGYVESLMTAQNNFPMPFMMTAARAAKIIARGLTRNKARIVFPLPMHFLVWLMGALPPAWVDPLLKKMPRKD